MAVALEPELVHKTEAQNIPVDLAGYHTRGHSTVDWLGRTGKEPNVNLLLEAHADRF
jgi:purine nucleosidase